MTNWREGLRRRWVRYELKRVARSSAPILVGPFWSELGFEVSYFIPWLAAWVKRHQIDKDRLIIVSRGGAGKYYGVLQTAELFEFLPVATLRQKQLEVFQKVGSVKQNRRWPWEAKTLALVAEHLHLRRYTVVHPSWMYADLCPWWDGRWGLAQLLERVILTPLAVPGLDFNLKLPAKYVALKFYARPTLEHTEAHQGWIEQVIEKFLTKHKDVDLVSLDSGIDADDHAPFLLPTSDRIHRIDQFCTPENNLAVQAAVLAKASGFLGTYGGSMQLAVRYGKPSVGFYQDLKGTCYSHVAWTEFQARQQGTPLLIGRPQDAGFVTEALG